MMSAKNLISLGRQFVTYNEETNNLANLFVRIGQAMDVRDSTAVAMSELFG